MFEEIDTVLVDEWNECKENEEDFDLLETVCNLLPAQIEKMGEITLKLKGLGSDLIEKCDFHPRAPS